MKKSWMIFFSFIFLMSIFLFTINFVSAAEGCNGDADCLLGETCNQNSLACQDAALVGQWTFNVDARDSSGNLNHGTLQGGAAITPGAGPDGSAALFLDGIDDFVNVPSSPSLNVATTSSYTWGTWINPNAFNKVIMAKSLSTSNWVGFQLMSDGSLCAWFDSVGCTIRSAANLIPLNTFTHVAVTFDDINNELKLYINGALVQTASETRSPTGNTAPLIIGDTSISPGFNFGGKIDDVRVYNRALSAAEIANLAGTCPGGLCGQWNFNDLSANDSSIFSNHGTLTNGASIQASAGPDGSAALSLDGIDDYVRVPDSPTLSLTTEGSLSFWMKIDPSDTAMLNVVGSERLLLTKGSGGGDLSYGLLLRNFGGKPSLEFFVDGDGSWGPDANINGNVLLSSDTWYHVTGTWDSVSGTKLYVNGVPDGSAPYISALDTTGTLFIGGGSGLSPAFKGTLDDARIYNRALDAAEIDQLAHPIIVPLFPAGVSGTTGTVKITAATTGEFGDTLTITGGTSGGDIDVVNSANVLTIKVNVPANTITTMSVNSAGESTILSTDATIAAPLIFENLRTTFLNTYLKKQSEVLLRLAGQQKIEVYQKDLQTIGFKSSSTNLQGEGVQFSIMGGASSSSDCDSVTCASLGGTCNGNWCLPNAEIGKAFSTRGISINGGLFPNEDLQFKIEQAFGENIFDLETFSGLSRDLEFRKINNVFAKLKMSQNAKAGFFLDNVKGIAAVAPNSPGIEITLPSSLEWMFYGLKVRQLDKGKISAAAPANYKFETNGDGILDVEYNSRLSNTFFDKVVGSGYEKLSPTGANGYNLVFFSLSSNLAPVATLTYNKVTQAKTLTASEATAFNFVVQKDKLGNEVTVAGNSRTITGSLIEEISPAAIIEGWNYWYTATDDNYWNWNVVLESLPSGCVADKTSASAMVANGVQTLAFYVNCGTTTSTTGAVVSGMAIEEGVRGFATKGKATLLSEFSECTEISPNGMHRCKPSQKFKDESAQVVKGVMNPTLTGSAVSGLGETESSILIVISLLTLAGIIALITLQVRRKSVDW